ncbi:MAG TPA: MOSC domain-containing protein [Actinomycetota bacterium]
MRTVSRLSVAPVKSLGLQHPERIRLEPWGVPGNRAFYLIDGDGRLFAGSKHGPLVRVGAAYDATDCHLSLRFPDGCLVEGRPEATGAPVETDFYGRPVPGRIVEGPWAEALSAYVGRPVRLVRPDREGDANDVWPVSLLSIASAEELARRSGKPQPLDSRRFRMLIEMDGCSAHEEDTWVGRDVRVGGATLRVPGAIPRCVVTTQDPSTGVRDFATLKEISRYRVVRNRNVPFGVYGEVLEPGDVRVGDPVEPPAA